VKEIDRCSNELTRTIYFCANDIDLHLRLGAICPLASALLSTPS